MICPIEAFRSMTRASNTLLTDPLLVPWAIRSPEQTLRFLGLKAYAKLVQRLNREAIRSRTQWLCGTATDRFGQAKVTSFVETIVYQSSIRKIGLSRVGALRHSLSLAIPAFYGHCMDVP
jgi:hypothetical protein